MTIGKINIEEAIAGIEAELKADKSLSPSLLQSIRLLITVIQLLVERLGLNSGNSSTPSSKESRDKKKKKSSRQKSDKSSGGQPGHKGSTLERVEYPDEIVEIPIDRRTLPDREDLKPAGYEARQIIDIVMDVNVTEYRAEAIEDTDGNRYVATFPEQLSKAVQYGSNIRALSTYMSQYQLIPYGRVQELISDQFGLKISEGSIANFNKEAYEKLGGFEEKICQTLTSAEVLNTDETGIKIGDKNHWIHVICTPKTTFFFPHAKRGKDAIADMGIIENFKGVLCHDGWKPYFSYDCEHSLCNAHHLRELEWVVEFKSQKWAKLMKKLLCEIKNKTEASGGALKPKIYEGYIKKYRKILKDAKKECPILLPAEGSGKKTVSQTKERNLRDRLEKYEAWVLLFAKKKNVPFTNNQAERDIRMAKVHQKISGCFRSMAGARYFCRIRSYLLTNLKRGESPYKKLLELFEPKNAE